VDFDFSQNLMVKDITLVPEDFRALYAEDKVAGDHKIKSDDPTVKGAVAALVGMSKALKARRIEKPIDLTPLGEYGRNPEEVVTWIKTKVDDYETRLASKAKIDLEKLKTELNAPLLKENHVLKEINGSVTGQLKAVLVDTAIRSALGDKAIDQDLVMPHVKDKLQVSQEDGKFQVFVVDIDGRQRVSGTTAQPLTIDELVKEMRASPKYAPLFKSDAPRGSGSSPGASSTRSLGSEVKLSSLEKISLGLERGEHRRNRS